MGKKDLEGKVRALDAIVWGDTCYIHARVMGGSLGLQTSLKRDELVGRIMKVLENVDRLDALMRIEATYEC